MGELSPFARVGEASGDDMQRFYGVEFKGLWAAKALRKGSLVAGMGGAFEIEPGIWFAFLDVSTGDRRPSVYRHILQVFAEAKKQGATMIRAHCTQGIPRAQELMERLGFIQTDEMIDGKAVWYVRL